MLKAKQMPMDMHPFTPAENLILNISMNQTKPPHDISCEQAQQMGKKSTLKVKAELNASFELSLSSPSLSGHGLITGNLKWQAAYQGGKAAMWMGHLAI